jgi:dimethylhistidine N-methyltransferase
MEQLKTKLSQFALDVKQGLGAESKHISSKYFYDEEGDRIFQQIMEMPEYYLTRAEFEILSEQKDQICEAMQAFTEPFNLIEFGAGDGLKTKVLLRHLIERNANFTYFPVDISQNILMELSDNLTKDFPELKFQTLNDDYFGALQKMENFNNRRNITLFLGSNIGNFHLDEAADFLKKLSNNCKPGDMLLLGVDLKKDHNIITQAYNDPHGITAAFNLNLLTRMNRELGADFNLNNFKHDTYYEPESGEVLSFLVSEKEQSVYIKNLETIINFEKGERIHTEISRKYDFEELDFIAANDGFEVINYFVDSNNYFTDALWKII